MTDRFKCPDCRTTLQQRGNRLWCPKCRDNLTAIASKRIKEQQRLSVFKRGR